MSTEEKLKRFAQLLESYKNSKRQLKRHADMIMGRKYAKIDYDYCGQFMVELSTEKVYGIKAYGVINRRRYYGTLDEIIQKYETQDNQ